MKNFRQIRNALLALTALAAFGCTDSKQAGLVVQPEDDRITVFTDTFSVTANESYNNVITAQCDTSAMALGEFYSERFGSTKAELLVQFAPPVGYEFPPDSLLPTPDSLVLYMYYNSYFGSKTAPLEISIYEIDKQTIAYDKIYYSDLDVSDFTDESVLMGRRVITSVDQTLPDSVLDASDYVPSFRYKFSDEQMNRFFNLPQAAYQSREAFLDEFKGLYITTKYGASTMLYFNQIAMKLFYHYNVHRNNKDTLLYTSIIFPANREVRQLNRFEHGQFVADSLADDSLLLVKSPAGLYPRVHIPVGKMRQQIRANIGDNLYNVNSAVLEAEVVVQDDGDLTLPTPSALLLLRESQLDKFATDEFVPQSVDSLGAVALYDSDKKLYQFDLAYLMTYEVRDSYDKIDDEETFAIVPCKVLYNSAGSISSVSPLRQLSGLSLRSANNTLSPMRIKMIYNGF